MIVKKLEHNCFDVFVGNGWENWCRFRLISAKGKKFLSKVAGRAIPAENMAQLRILFKTGA